jgi:hypothetical protein
MRQRPIITSFTHSRAVEIANKAAALTYMATDIWPTGGSLDGGMEKRREHLIDWMDKYGYIRKSLTDGVMAARRRGTYEVVVWRLCHADQPWVMSFYHNATSQAVLDHIDLPTVDRDFDPPGGDPRLRDIVEERLK